MSFDLYSEVTNQIVAMLEQGVVPWRSPILGRTSAGHPRNLASGKEYRGVNVFLLAFTAWSKGYGSAYWLTFKQAKEKGGSVKKGEKSSIVVFWKQHEITDEETGDIEKIPVLRHYNVFNVEQCEGIAAPDAVSFEPLDFKPIEQAERIISGYADGPKIEHGGQQAFYLPGMDTVCMPDPSRFVSCEQYYATLLHELAHSTGHSKRLDRKLDTELRPFGSADYGNEELIAEMASAFLCAAAGIEPATLHNQAAYIYGWIQRIKADKRLVIQAAGAGQKATEWIRDIRTKIGSDEGAVIAG